MLKRILTLVLTFVLFVFVTTPVLAQIKVEQIDKVYSDHLQSIPGTLTDITENIPDKAIVEQEVYYLENQIPTLQKVDWKIVIVNQKLSFSSIPNAFAGGVALKQDKIVYLFSQPENGIEGTVSHEMGHLFRFEFMSDKSLNNYVNFINYRSNLLNVKEMSLFEKTYNSSEELFAEDFKMLFGSEESKSSWYRPNYDLPGQNEKSWMIRNFNLDENILTWEEKLELYKFDYEEGLKEVTRSEIIQRNKLAKGDIKGANSAKVWANQIRQVIGLPLQ